MIEVVIDRDRENLQNGASFKHNINREVIEIRKVDECRDI